MKNYILIFTLIFATSVDAGTLLSAQKVTGLANGWGGTNLYITTDKNLEAESCSATDKRVVLEDAHPQFDIITSILLSALHTKSDVRLYISGCGSNNFMKLMSVQILAS